ALPDADATRTEALQRQRQPAIRNQNRALRRRGKRCRKIADPRKDVEQDRRRRSASENARHGRPVRPANPDSDGTASVETYGPGVSVTVGGAGLEGDAVARSVRGRRRSD